MNPGCQDRALATSRYEEAAGTTSRSQSFNGIGVAYLEILDATDILSLPFFLLISRHSCSFSSVIFVFISYCRHHHHHRRRRRRCRRRRRRRRRRRPHHHHHHHHHHELFSIHYSSHIISSAFLTCSIIIFIIMIR